MKKSKTTLKFDEWMEQVIKYYGEEDVMKKIKFIRDFLKVNFQVDELDNSYVEIKRLHSKSLMWLLMSLIIDYDTMKEKPNEQLSKQHELGDSASTKMKIMKKMGMQEKYISLEVDDIFPYSELTSAEARFIENLLDKINADIESEDQIKYIMSIKQLIFLITGVMREHTIFIGSARKFEQ